MPLEEVSSAIVEAVHWVLERTPPELTGDISANGITMTGGGSLIWGFDKLIASKTAFRRASRTKRFRAWHTVPATVWKICRKCRTAR